MSDEPRRKGLGRGLAALLGDDADETAGPARTGGQDVPIELIRPNPNQPRQHFDEAALEELADSIREKGILQPILVRPITEPGFEYEIVAGERRWRAAQRAQLHRVPVIVKSLTDGESLELALVENVQRRDLNPVEAAHGYQRLIDEFGYSQEKVGQMVGKSRSAVANQLRLLGLPDSVQAMLRDGRLTEGHARTLLSAADPAALAEQIAGEGLTVRQAEELASVRRRVERSTDGGAPKGAKPVKDADTLALEHSLSLATGLKVVIDHKGSAGELRLTYKSLEQLDQICRLLSQAAGNQAVDEDPIIGPPDPDLVASELAALVRDESGRS
jgi:ParB family chromosome partitioning protein